jgi:arginyl-tRNA synthetase
MLAFDGNTAPYLQYAYARISGVFEKGNIDRTQCSTPPRLDVEVERQLAVHLLRFQEVLEQVVADVKPHYLCSYLYELTVRFMRFYEQCPVLSESPEIRDGRLTLCSRTAETLETGMNALGIRALTRM